MSEQSTPSGALQVRGLHDAATGTVTYVVWDPASHSAAVIDPVLDYEPRASRTGTASVDAVARLLDEQRLRLRWILETHIHADHLSGASLLRAMRGGETCIGARIDRVREQWSRFFPEVGRTDGAAFDRLLDDGATLLLGSHRISVMYTPGHTPACVTYLTDGMAFVGDALFMPDAGTGRCDFPGGSAIDLFRSIRKILALPSGTRLFTGHDYGRPGGGPPAWASSVEEQRSENVHVKDGVSEDEYVTMRTARDRTLPAPALMWAALQVNLRGGRLPDAEENGLSCLRIPVDAILPR